MVVVKEIKRVKERERERERSAAPDADIVEETQNMKRVIGFVWV